MIEYIGNQRQNLRDYVSRMIKEGTPNKFCIMHIVAEDL